MRQLRINSKPGLHPALFQKGLRGKQLTQTMFSWFRSRQLDVAVHGGVVAQQEAQTRFGREVTGKAQYWE